MAIDGSLYPQKAIICMFVYVFRFKLHPFFFISNTNFGEGFKLLNFGHY